MVSISLCMIVKNEEAVIGRCLTSVKDLVDEINIIDTGSTDNTKQIVKEFTDRIFDFEWIHHFAAARNFSFQQATKEYILWLDADDVLLEEDQEKFKALKESLTLDIDAVSMNYNLSFDNEGNVSSLLRRYRLVRRDKQFQWIGAVHEYLEVGGKLLDSNVAVSHLPLSHDHSRNINIYKQLVDSGEPLSPRDTFYYANELLDHGQFEDAIFYYETFLTSKLGWVEDNITACFKLADCYSHLNDPENNLSSILRSFEYDIPRPEACCRLGFLFMEQAKTYEAIFWYEQALNIKQNPNAPFQNKTFTTWLPHLQLCVLFDRLQQYELANAHNELARSFLPNDEKILHNKKYFERILNKENETS
ncbi:glycosyltransferase family 2 protein [Lysinibacillus sphaericus]|uniref:Glycosyltransferase family 2 protein n=1 Tax=Lysinibacillus sphaericus TaxID=1421 RepID=A0A544UG41_LYSSH|nr:MULTISPECIES: glycosyltransferase family 2 protein [unclassified Lysinibacillus]MDD1504012.1 glycosyltransferase family 2 protein [Lysinibacillus sp. CNPSo 3705]TQR31637.1 glycosyltransferase family 2 protein [Lysinibacillus sp. SDF0037]